VDQVVLRFKNDDQASAARFAAAAAGCPGTVNGQETGQSPRTGVRQVGPAVVAITTYGVSQVETTALARLAESRVGSLT